MHDHILRQMRDKIRANSTPANRRGMDRRVDRHAARHARDTQARVVLGCRGYKGEMLGIAEENVTELELPPQ